MSQDWKGFRITVTNTVTTPVENLLPGANFCQVFIPDDGTAQAITISNNGSGSVRIPSGGSFELPIRHHFNAGETIFSVQTATGSTALQVLLMRKPF